MNTDTIIALSTPSGTSAIAVLRMSGNNAITIADQLFVGKKLADQLSHTVHFGKWLNHDQFIDEVLIALFKNPHSYNGEDTVEISCHGSSYIIQQILQSVLDKGARLALPGEFTKRAFMNGKLDLSQAEAVTDIIASENAAQHKIAMQQMRGGYSNAIKHIRQELIDFAALIELELDFSEEDVTFADRDKLLVLLSNAIQEIEKLIQSFKIGNVIKKGVPVAIVGKPNVGKSTLLNRLLNEEKAIVSELAGTTRDYIEDTLQLNGITYRFIDTAGIRDTHDILESKGIARSYEKIKEADIIFYVADIHEPFQQIVADYKSMEFNVQQQVFILLNKSDQAADQCNAYDIEEAISTLTQRTTLEISAQKNKHIDKLISLLENAVQVKSRGNDIIVSNSRHVEAFQIAKQSLMLVQKGIMENISGEFISIDLRTALQALGSITGQISNEDVLSSVFSRFCIGK